MAYTGTGRVTICPTLLYADAQAAITMLTEAFGFLAEAVYLDEDDLVSHAELSYGNGMVMVRSKGRGGMLVQAVHDGGPASVYVVVDDVDEHHRRAAAHGVEILMPPADQDYGSRDYVARDAEGNVWTFGTYTPAGGVS
jgi:uncharacterized glyoxalase superfamily protein PhnB